MRSIIIIFCLIFIAGFNIFSPTWLPTYRDENGYTIPYNFPPPDSSYLHNEIIIFFKPQALFLNKLCYDIQSSSSTKSKDKDVTLSITNNFIDLPSGIYFLNILVDGSSKTVKLIYEGK